MFTRAIFLGVVLMGLLGMSKVASHDARKQSLPSRRERPVAAVETRGEQDRVAFAVSYDTAAQQVTDYLEGLERERLAVQAYLDGLEAERLVREAAAAEAARLAAARQAPRAAPAGSGNSAVTVTGACGGATNGADRFIARESGGNPNIYNAGGSGAWGCYQIMPGTWASSCADIGAYGSASPAQQAACASRLPLSAWGG